MRNGCPLGVVVVCVLAAVIGLAGCGGGSSSSSSSYDKRASALCQSMRDSLRHLGPAPHTGSRKQLESAGPYFRQRASDISRTTDRLSTLQPPERERPAVNRLLRTMRRTDQLETNQFRAALRGYRPGFLRASAAIRPSLGVEGKAAASAHLQACAVES
jgi:hypothetical protein